MIEEININAGCPACMIKNDRIDELETKLKQKRNRVGIDYSEYNKLEAENKILREAVEKIDKHGSSVVKEHYKDCFPWFEIAKTALERSRRLRDE